MRLLLSWSITILFLSCRSKEKIEISFPDGGYPYPQIVDGKDSNFFQYPVKNIVSTRDSFWTAYYTSYLLTSFEEPNLSLRLPEENVFRFVFVGGLRYDAIIVLKQGGITVKERKTGSPYPDDSKINLLSPLEREHVNLLFFYFPLNEYARNDKRKKYIDSAIKASPELLDPKYYRQLLGKMESTAPEPFSYKEWTKQLTKRKYLYFVDKLNKSEYWKLPPHPSCSDGDTDQDGFCLEAATTSKYHAVNFTNCDSLIYLNAWYDELMEYSGVNKSMEELREKYWKERSHQ